jgi:hypothetical protein
MKEETPQQSSLSCPHLGILDDPDSSHDFPSMWNYCFHCKSPTVPNFEHQKMVCLTAEHFSCPVYQAAKEAAFPDALRSTVKPLPEQPQSSKRIYVYIAATILLLALAGWSASTMITLPAGVIPSFLNSGQPEKTTVNIIATASVQPTAIAQVTKTSVPTASITITPTSELPAVVIKTPVLETSFKIGDNDFLLHKIKAGEGLDYLAKIYSTTSEVIQATNYSLSLPILVDSVILIRPGTATLGPAEPSFQLYQVTDKTITLEKLAKNLGVNLVQLKYYNACPDRCIISKGDWILIARQK